MISKETFQSSCTLIVILAIAALIFVGMCALAERDMNQSAIPHCYFIAQPYGQSLEFHGKANVRQTAHIFSELQRLEFQDGAVIGYVEGMFKVKTEYCETCNPVGGAK